MNDRATFAADELALVLSHYDLGVIGRIKEYPRGSRKSPKVLVRCEQGEFILKRRALGKDDPERVAFAHGVQTHLAARGFPLPSLVVTRRHGHTMIQHAGCVYELFSYIRGEAFDRSPEEAGDAGRVLAQYHKLLHDYDAPAPPAMAGYHGNPGIVRGFAEIPTTFRRLATLDDAAAEPLATLLTYLSDSYAEATEQADRLGLAGWPAQVVHCDWHPGNTLYRGKKVVAVLDYDAVRVQQRVVDIANGVLQFSMLGGPDEIDAWPDALDEDRFRRFCGAYDAEDVVSVAEIQAIPWLMVEALIAESVVPIAATGSFGRIAGVGFLRMVERKVRWLKANASRLTDLLKR